MQLKATSILNLLIEKSPLTEEFKTVTEVLGFHTFSNLLAHRTTHLLTLPGFTQHLIYEYVEFLEDHQLGQLIDP